MTDWRDLTALVVAREGDTVTKSQLAPRFQEAIDEAAMRLGGTGADAYLDGWGRSPWAAAEGHPARGLDRGGDGLGRQQVRAYELRVEVGRERAQPVGVEVGAGAEVVERPAEDDHADVHPLAALDAGAIVFVQKPTALATEKIFAIGDELVAKVMAAAGAPLGASVPRAAPPT